MVRYSTDCPQRAPVTPLTMELPNLDKHCSHKDCKQLDFLPLECKCKRLFCSKHFALHAEECPLKVDVVSEDKSKIEEVYKCSEAGCKSTSLVPLICEKCKQHFCVTHRHVVGCSPPDPEVIAAEKEKYAAPVKQFNDVKANIDQKVSSYILLYPTTMHASSRFVSLSLLNINYLIDVFV